MTDGDIILSLGLEELLCQLAEEAAELSQAALKLRRALDGKNPTPKSVMECLDELVEEYADVFECMKLCVRSMNIGWGYFNRLVNQAGEEKVTRWRHRLEAVQDENQVQPDV